MDGDAEVGDVSTPVANDEDAMNLDEEEAEDLGAEAEGSDDDEDGSDQDEDDDEDEGEPIESLVSGREKRSTAGSRYNQLLNATLREDADDDITLLFAEEGEDEEFDERKVVVEEGDDDDDSSSDEEDRAGPDDELEGEKQLEKEERAAKRAQKRKAQEALDKRPAPRKRVKIDESANLSRATSEAASTTKPLTRVRKRSDRVSWINTGDDGSVRSSKRTLAVQNKERTLASMQESEARRERQLHIMEKAQRRREEAKANVMTQAERLAEAAEVERINSSSLNKWEEAEEERRARQKARLEALHNRTLDGPVIRFYSGPAEWTNGRLTRVGKRILVVEVSETSVRQEPKKLKPGRKPGSGKAKSTDPPELQGRDAGSANEPSDIIMVENTPAPESHVQDVSAALPPTTPVVVSEDIPNRPPAVDAGAAGIENPPSAIPPEVETTTEPKKEDTTFLDGLEYYASLNEEEEAARDATQPHENNEKLSTISVPVHPTEAISSTRSGLVGTGVSSDKLAIRTTLHQDVNQDPQSGISPMTIAPHQQPGLQPEQSFTNPESANPTNTTQSATSSQPPQPTPSNDPPTTTSPLPLPSPPHPTPLIETSTRNHLTLLNYPPSALTPDNLRRILFAWPAPHLCPNTSSSTRTSFASTSTSARSGALLGPRPYGQAKFNAGAFTVHRPVQPVCVVTGREARYLDPGTGLPYAGVKEFGTLRRMAGVRLGEGEGTATSATKGAAAASAATSTNAISSAPGPVWSSLLGAYVGAGGRRRLPVPETATSSEETEESIRWRSARTVSEAFVGGVVEAEEKQPALPVVPAGAPAALGEGGGMGSGSSNAPTDVAAGGMPDVKMS